MSVQPCSGRRQASAASIAQKERGVWHVAISAGRTVAQQVVSRCLALLLTRCDFLRVHLTLMAKFANKFKAVLGDEVCQGRAKCRSVTLRANPMVVGHLAKLFLLWAVQV